MFLFCNTAANISAAEQNRKKTERKFLVNLEFSPAGEATEKKISQLALSLSSTLCYAGSDTTVHILNNSVVWFVYRKSD